MLRIIAWLFAISGLSSCGGSPLPSAHASPTPLRIAVIGDSITAGYMPYGSAMLALRQDLSYTSELSQAGDVYTAAVGGASTEAALGTQPQWLAGVDPDVVVIMLGTNDAVLGMDRGQALRNVIDIADKWARARVVLVAPPKWDAMANAWLDPWSADLRALAAARGARFVDAFASSRPEWLCHPVDKHPCEVAHREIGKMVLKEVLF